MIFSHPTFPNSNIDPFLLTGPKTTVYNCIAWVYGVIDKWFWPDSSEIYYWPKAIPRAENIDAFVKLFESIGYSVCDNGNLEKNFQKVAIYTDNTGKPTHAARQLKNGLWTSKLGQSYDVTHTIYSMTDGRYGNVAVFMKRKSTKSILSSTNKCNTIG